MTGQDGAYLSQFLLEKGYSVVGIVRSYTAQSFPKLEYLGVRGDIRFEEVDLLDLSQCLSLMARHRPDEVYNLAAQSSVSLSFAQPIGTIGYNTNSVLNLLEAIRMASPATRFYQASSSEMFGQVQKLPISLDDPLNPVSPYAISKAAAHHITNLYRDSYRLFAVTGVLFNHESYLRTDNFFIKKLVTGCLRIRAGHLDKLQLGNLNVKRDFGFAKEYVRAMWAMLQRATPKNYMICSGRSLYLHEIVAHVVSRTGVEPGQIEVSPSNFRPNEIHDIFGDNSAARSELDWHCTDDFFTVLDWLIEEERANLA